MWILAARSRVTSCQRFIEAWHKSQASTPVYVRLDECDTVLNDLLALDWPKQFTIHVGPRQGLRAAMEEMFQAHPNEPWYGILADDLVPQTPYWDQLLVERAGANCISYPNDLGRKTKLPTHPCVGGDLVRTQGWFGLPVVRHYCVDNAYRYIGDELGIKYRLDDVIVEHVHFSTKKTERDMLYKETNIFKDADDSAFALWLQDQGPELIARLREQGFSSQ
jgi:hypothetical protein